MVGRVGNPQAYLSEASGTDFIEENVLTAARIWGVFGVANDH